MDRALAWTTLMGVSAFPREDRTMTATAPLDVGSQPAVRTPMLPFLQGLHEQWLREVRSVVDPARSDLPGPRSDGAPSTISRPASSAGSSGSGGQLTACTGRRLGISTWAPVGRRRAGGPVAGEHEASGGALPSLEAVLLARGHAPERLGGRRCREVEESLGPGALGEVPSNPESCSRRSPTTRSCWNPRRRA